MATKQSKVKRKVKLSGKYTDRNNYPVHGKSL